jgi:hypothetical protein
MLLAARVARQPEMGLADLLQCRRFCFPLRDAAWDSGTLNNEDAGFVALNCDERFHGSSWVHYRTILAYQKTGDSCRWRTSAVPQVLYNVATIASRVTALSFMLGDGSKDGHEVPRRSGLWSGIANR